MDTIRAGIAGAAGYSGLELFRILARHPQVSISFITSEQCAGRPISDFLPEQAGGFDPHFVPLDAQQLANQADVVFLALPPESSLEHAEAFLRSARVIDLSAAFRLKDALVYEKWYKHPHTAGALLPKAVYGLSEWNRDALRGARLIANPGCYPTSVLIPMLPLVHKGCVSDGSVIVDSKSGVSGMGRKITADAAFMQINENFRAYGVGTHRHTPEIAQELNSAGKGAVDLVFTPHLLPIERGILSTIYFRSDFQAEECRCFLAHFYEGEPFVRVLEDTLPETARVAHTNLCVCTVVPSGVDGTLIAISAIDNLVKGAAGQAVQNMNIAFGFSEELAL
ncbi:MAG: N-acetyl-gamma-glutamyl-phosphate reductase [Spirochaetota bacterium]|jgi:N-acetyl-gamma-glutamyl-phosphate reductase|nr:N-acetyl-gamma-glutamyl-phosphate reductase [Spirochaetota bacterium]